MHFDPYTGQILGDPVEVDRTLTGWLLRLHYTLLRGTVGTLAAGPLAVALLLLGCSGVWMYRGFWRNLLALR